MTTTIDYYLAPQSPWTYLGHARLVSLAKLAGATVQLLPIDLGRVFPVSGGLPLAKRAPQRQAYRLVELQRFAHHLALPLVLQPRFFPVAGDPAARLIIAVALAHGTAAGLEFAGAVLAAVWAQQRNIAAPDVLGELLLEQQLPSALLAAAGTDEVQRVYDANTQAAIDAGVFGAPTYGLAGELFWGQDRLEFLQRRLSAI